MFQNFRPRNNHFCVFEFATYSEVRYEWDILSTILWKSELTTDGFCRQNAKSLRIPGGIIKIMLSYYHDESNELPSYKSPMNFGFGELLYLRVKYDDEYFYLYLWLRALPYPDLVYIDQVKVILISKDKDYNRRKFWKASDLRLGHLRLGHLRLGNVKGMAYKGWKFDKKQMMKDLANRYLVIELTGVKCELNENRRLVFDPLMFGEHY